MIKSMYNDKRGYPKFYNLQIVNTSVFEFC